MLMSPTKAYLTKREEQLLKHLASGGTIKTFAGRYNLAEDTVKKHRNNLHKAIDCHCRAELTQYAIKFGYVILPTYVVLPMG